MTKTLILAALAAAIAMPALADDGVMPQGSKIIINKTETQQGVAKGHEAKSGKRHAHHWRKGAHKKHHRMHKAAAHKKAAK
jgi:hypothetical protein